MNRIAFGIAPSLLTIALSIVLALAGPPPRAHAQEAPGDTVDVSELRRRIEAITRELEELRLGRELVVEADTSLYGLGPAASKVYKVQQGVSIGGYGEVLYENFAEEREDDEPSGRTDQVDFLRAILYAGYKFTDRILFNSELEFEHGSTGGGVGEVSVEFAYVDYLVTPGFGVRGGMLLVPMGLVNELHEPTSFLGTTRPETERQILPSTWRENGLGVFGEAGAFSWRAYLVNGFDAIEGGSSNAEGFGAEGLRGGRSSGARAVAEEFAGVGRADYVGVPGLRAGGSVYLGNSGQDAPDPSDPDETIGAFTTILEGHADYRAAGFDLRGLVAVATVDDVPELNAAQGLAGDESIGERMVGWYVQAGYDVLSGLDTQNQLVPYVRYERIDTQDEVPEGFAADPANERDILLIGAAWKPIPNVVVKADYQIRSNEAETGVNQLNAVLGYIF